MTEFREPVIAIPRKKGISRYRPAVIIIAPLVAILFKIYIAQLIPQLSYLSLPLLVVVYFSLMRRSQITGVFLGAAVGILQDSLSDKPIGMFGIVMTLVGYFAASVSLRFDVGNLVIRFILAFFFYFFHEFFYWVMARALLGEAIDFNAQPTLLLGLLNATVAIPLFAILDKLKATE